MESKFTNIHVHVFNTECAPENFLRIIKSPVLQIIPRQIKWLLDQKAVRWSIWQLHAGLKFLSKKYKKKWSGLIKYIAFLNVGTKKTQYDIFSMALKVVQKEDGDGQLVALTLDMDYMDNVGAKPKKQLEAQLEEVKNIKRFHPDHFFPFLGIDPRARSGQSLVDWSKNYLEFGVQSHATKKYYPFFCGLKMYPALGFFPFDPRLDAIYAYAEKNGIPIMTHCTRGGSQYVGNNIETLIPKSGIVPMIDPSGSDGFNAAKFKEAKSEIEERIKRYHRKGWVKNSRIGNNFEACDLFGHPQNYIPVMMKYPKLKICLAHMGGSDEMVKDPTPEQTELWNEIDGKNWAVYSRELMTEYDHLYTDISYSLYELSNEYVKQFMIDWCNKTDHNEAPLSNRILFGTDFYMTEREMKEPELYALAKEHLDQWYQQIATTNISSFLAPKP